MKKKRAKFRRTEKHPMQAEVLERIASARKKATEAQLKAHSIAEKLQLIIDEADVTMPLVSN
jgi:ABC-type thiamine transport system substrate-binding protein